MKFILLLEQIAQMAIALFCIHLTSVDLPWWAWILLFFAPDIGMLGYVINTQVGAITYNLFHHKAVAIALVAAGYFLGNDGLLVAGFLLYAHSCFDRIFGYGLKFGDAFKHTHLGWLK